jgi:ABC-type transport system involved in multi-copper enzyme maturation permease subunit
MGILGAVAWSSFGQLRVQRAFLTKLEAGNVTPQNFFEFSPGVSCFGGGGLPPGAGVEPASTDSGSTPGGKGPTPTTPEENKPICQFIAPDGQPIGPQFHGDPFERFRNGEVSQQFIDELKPALVRSLETQITTIERDLTPRRLFDSRVRMLGTFVGILFAVLFASTFFGAEVRWGVWRTLLTHEPRRGKMIASKFGAMLTYVLIGFALALIITSVVDVVMRSALDVTATSATPTIAHLAKETGWAALTLGTYASIAGALTLTVRTSLAGAVTFLLVLGDHLLVTKFTWLRAYLPVQQVSSLLPRPRDVASGYAWSDPILVKFECIARRADVPFRECKDIALKPIPHWRASLVLGGWLIAFVFAAWAAFRSRDIPQ